jgi:hypothetical protein
MVVLWAIFVAADLNIVGMVRDYGLMRCKNCAGSDISLPTLNLRNLTDADGR